MSDPENFLNRWSRRKIEGERRAPAGTDAASAEGKASPRADADKSASDSATAPEKKAEPSFDLSKLPSLDSIGVDTDISVFLRPGVPADLSRAALRRAWAADPAIRDFVGLAENAWDFTAPDSMPGFGPLGAEEARKLIADFLNNEFGEAKAGKASEEVSAAHQPPESLPVQREIVSFAEDTKPSSDDAAETRDETHAMLQSSKDADDSAAQRDREDIAVGNTRRGHGSALPN